MNAEKVIREQERTKRADLDQALACSERFRQSILKRAFEGKLVPQDPNDEPAFGLLERFQAEKQKPKRESPKQLELL